MSEKKTPRIKLTISNNEVGHTPALPSSAHRGSGRMRRLSVDGTDTGRPAYYQSIMRFSLVREDLARNVLLSAFN